MSLPWLAAGSTAASENISKRAVPQPALAKEPALSPEPERQATGSGNRVTVGQAAARAKHSCPASAAQQTQAEACQSASPLADQRQARATKQTAAQASQQQPTQPKTTSSRLSPRKQAKPRSLTASQQALEPASPGLEQRAELTKHAQQQTSARQEPGPEHPDPAGPTATPTGLDAIVGSCCPDERENVRNTAQLLAAPAQADAEARSEGSEEELMSLPVSRVSLLQLIDQEIVGCWQ